MADIAITTRKSPVRPLVRVGLRAVGFSAAALMLVSACSAAGSESAGGTGSARVSLTPRQALLTASTQANKLTSASEDVIIRGNGTQNLTMIGTLEFRRSPSLVFSENLTFNQAGKKLHVKAILTNDFLYFSEPLLTRNTGKPWIKLDLSTVNHTPLADLAPFLRSMEDIGTFKEIPLFAAADNAHVIGKQAVAGVPTTEYAGSFRASELPRALPPGLRKALASVLTDLGGGVVRFRVWIDGQHQVRKAIDIGASNGDTVIATVNVTAVNRPVQISLPPASQTSNPERI